jgi:hypothetical protein
MVPLKCVVRRGRACRPIPMLTLRPFSRMQAHRPGTLLGGSSRHPGRPRCHARGHLAGHHAQRPLGVPDELQRGASWRVAPLAAWGLRMAVLHMCTTAACACGPCLMLAGTANAYPHLPPGLAAASPFPRSRCMHRTPRRSRRPPTPPAAAHSPRTSWPAMRRL